MKCWPEFCSNCESNSWRSWLQLLDKKLKISKHLHILFSATPATNGGPAKVSSANANLIDRIENDIHRMRRTIYLLISMGLVFCVCWLPLNIVNLVSLPLYSSLSCGLFIPKDKWKELSQLVLLYFLSRVWPLGPSMARLLPSVAELARQVRDHPFKTSACIRGEGCPHVPMVKRLQYIRIKSRRISNSNF